MTPDRFRASERLQAAIDSLRDLLFTVYMPGDFGARARALIADMQNERRRRATADIDKRPSCSPTWQEGWEAHARGYALYDGHTEQYRRGWLSRDRSTKGQD